MASEINILPINPGSDGDARRWPKHSYDRDDTYYEQRVAVLWIKDIPGGPEPNVTYSLDRLPHGYGGFQRTRPDGIRIDYFIYGHPNGKFDSVVKFYKHFKHLMQHGFPAGCECDNCSGEGLRKRAPAVAAAPRNTSSRDATPPYRSQYFTGAGPSAQGLDLMSPFQAKHRGRPRKYPLTEDRQSEPRAARTIDAEGTPDIYESLLAKLEKADRGTEMSQHIAENISPDWHVGNESSNTFFKQVRNTSNYIPRVGEIVLFVRLYAQQLPEDEVIAWDATAQTFRFFNTESRKWLDQPRWEAGVITQTPKEELSAADLLDDDGQDQALNSYGFRIEPLPEPGNEHKPYSKQYKYVPLHLIRPFAYWKECTRDVAAKDYHPTIRHALTIASTFCVVGRHRFRGTWPKATVYCRGAYIGAELITVGGVVRLLPRLHEQSPESATDVMVVTAIRLRFIARDLALNDLLPLDIFPYQVCVHVSGRVYTLDKSRSHDGIGSDIVDTESTSEKLPAWLKQYGTWYHYSDPREPSARIEVPYTRVLGRCYQSAATQAWFGPPAENSTFSESSRPAASANIGKLELSRGLRGLLDARKYSTANDKRINSVEGQSWFWADTRIEQLDLHEVNGRYVGIKRDRTAADLRKWRAGLKISSKRSVAAPHETIENISDHEELDEVEEQDTKITPSGYGMMAPIVSSRDSVSSDGADPMEHDSSDQVHDNDVSADAGNGEDDDDIMEVDEGSLGPHAPVIAKTVKADIESSPHKKFEVITLSDSDDDDDDPQAGELLKQFRTGNNRAR